MRTVASLLSLKKELLFHEAKPSEIVAVEGDYKLVIIRTVCQYVFNYTIQNFICGHFLGG